MEFESILLFVGLAITTILLFTLPFIPAIYEWRAKTDIKPLNSIFPDTTIIDYNIRIFKDFITHNFTVLISHFSAHNGYYKNKLEDGTEFLVFSQNDIISSKEIQKNQIISELLLACKAITLPDNTTFLNKIYALETVYTGKNNRIDSIYSENNIFIATDSYIIKLAYSAASITVDNNCYLHGYIKAQENIVLRGIATFQCLLAEKIHFGTTNINIIPATAVNVFSEKDIYHQSKNFRLPEKSNAAGHYITKKNFIIEKNSVLRGNIKCYKNLYIQSGTTIKGSIICEGNIYIEDNCIIQGPIIATKKIRFGENCIIGTLDSPTSVIAQHIAVSKGSIFCGLLLAKTQGLFQP